MIATTCPAAFHVAFIFVRSAAQAESSARIWHVNFFLKRSTSVMIEFNTLSVSAIN